MISLGNPASGIGKAQRRYSGWMGQVWTAEAVEEHVAAPAAMAVDVAAAAVAAVAAAQGQQTVHQAIRWRPWRIAWHH